MSYASETEYFTSTINSRIRLQLKVEQHHLEQAPNAVTKNNRLARLAAAEHFRRRTVFLVGLRDTYSTPDQRRCAVKALETLLCCGT